MTRSAHLHVRVDFDQRAVHGHIELAFDVLKDGVEEILLDSNVSCLEIEHKLKFRAGYLSTAVSRVIGFSLLFHSDFGDRLRA